MLRQIVKRRTYLLIAAHLVILSLAYEIAFQLRFDWAVPPSMRELFWKTIPALLALKLLFFQRLGCLHGWWRYVTFADLASLLYVATLSMIAMASIDYFLIPQFQIPRAVLVMDWGATILFVGGLRSVWRFTREHVWPTLRVQGDVRPTLLIASGCQGQALVHQIHSHPTLNFRVVGLLDDNPAHHGSYLGGIPILGGPEDAVEIAREREIRDILLLARSVSGTQLRELVDRCRAAQIQLKIIPQVDELLNGPFRLHLRDVDINDLLRRPPVQLDSEAISKMLAGQTVMVTGAGGSIGSEICRQLLKQAPQCLILVERAENSLFQIEQELLRTADPQIIQACIADISDEGRMRTIFSRYNPRIVFHCAAHKHVPLMERNPGEAVKNNVLGTVSLVDLAEEFEVERFVMISTDKAVNPTSVMGVTKQLAERYVHACSETSTTRFVVVRFGNVLASAGSVVPIFQEQIRRGGPVTVTHPEMRRYFMTIPEASQLVLQAAAMGKGGEIYVLDMGEPVKILDLAKDLIRLSGYSPDEIEIRFVGMRPGEKLYEELYAEEERMLPTPHPKLRAAYHTPYSREEVLTALAELEPLLHGVGDELRSKLRQIAPEYSPSSWVPTTETAITPDA